MQAHFSEGVTLKLDKEHGWMGLTRQTRIWAFTTLVKLLWHCLSGYAWWHLFVRQEMIRWDKKVTVTSMHSRVLLPFPCWCQRTMLPVLPQESQYFIWLLDSTEIKCRASGDTKGDFEKCLLFCPYNETQWWPVFFWTPWTNSWNMEQIILCSKGWMRVKKMNRI